MDSAAFPIESEDDLQDPLDFMSPIHCSHYLLFQPHFCPPAHLAVLEPEAQNLACTIPLAWTPTPTLDWSNYSFSESWHHFRKRPSLAPTV